MSKKRILLVDDEAGFTRLLKLTLRTFEICEVNDPLKALETARQFKPDMIFLDLIMPGVDGGTLAAQFKQEPALKEVPIVFLTAVLGPGEQPPSSGEEIISKPVPAKTIEQCIKKHLGL